MITVKLCVPVAPMLSVTATVKLELPSAVGVPERIPVLARDRPRGNVPAARLKLREPLPPEAVKVWV